jgi:hypothetical protein
MIRKTWYILVTVFFSSLNLLSQETGTIKGIIRDSANGEPVPFANVQIMGSKLGTSANSNGFYVIRNISFGKKTVLVTAVGYGRLVKTVNIISEDPILLNLFLNPDLIELKPVTKTAERVKDIYETNISVMSITQEDLKLLPIAVEKDIFRAIKTTAGISSTGDVTSQFYVRGGSGDQNLILFDNMLVYNPYHAFGLFSIFNTEAIKVSEVMTGGFGPEFGGRLSSVINIISKEGNTNRYSSKLNFGMMSGQGLIEGPLLDGSFFASYRKSYFDKVLKKIIGKDLPLDFYDFTGKITYPISREGKITINGLLSGDNINNSKISEPNYEWMNSSFGMSLQTFVDNNLATFTFSASKFRSAVDYKNQSNKTNNESSVSNVFLDTKMETHLSNNDILSYGLSFVLPTINYTIINNAGYIVKKEGNVHETNIFAKYKFTQINNFVMEAGVRVNVDYLGDDMSYVFEPRVGLKYQLFSDIALKCSYGRYHQKMVTTSNEDDIIPLFEALVPIESPFKPERNDEVIGGVDALFSENFNISLQGYYRRFQNLLGYNLKKSESTDPDFIAGTGQSYGFEAILKYQEGPIYAWLNYALSFAKKKIGRIIYYPKYDKRHIINMGVSANLPFGIALNMLWEISSGQPFTPIRSYFNQIRYDDLEFGDYNQESGTVTSIQGSKNSSRLPWYNRLDISFTKTFDLVSGIKINTSLDLINVYNAKNIFYFNKSTGEKMYMLPFLPSISLGVVL